MPMGMTAIQAIEHLRNLRVKEQNKKVMLKGQAASAPLVPTVEVLEDLLARVAHLEKEQDKKGVMVPDPSKSLLRFVLSENPAASEAAAAQIVKALMGRVLHEVRKLQQEQLGEVNAAVVAKNAEWRHTAGGACEALKTLDERLLALLR